MIFSGTHRPEVGTLKRMLTRLLRAACASELAAAIAYVGHAASVRDPAERARLRTIALEELRHRRALRRMLASCGVGPGPERLRRAIGRLASALCFVTGWFWPMYVAGRLEVHNVAEYRAIAAAARRAGRVDLEAELLEMSRVEREHETWFREKAASHWLWRLTPRW